MAHVLNREALRVVVKDDRGRVTYRKRYRKGDQVDVSKMLDTHVESLVKSGALVESKGDLSEEESATATSPTSGPFGAAATGLTGPEQPSGGGDGDGDGDGDEPPFDPDDPEQVDEYSSMDFAALQQAAKSRGLSGGGSAEDLRVRLRADDQS